MTEDLPFNLEVRLRIVPKILLSTTELHKLLKPTNMDTHSIEILEHSTHKGKRQYYDYYCIHLVSFALSKFCIHIGQRFV